jgi:hypothetical protein
VPGSGDEDEVAGVDVGGRLGQEQGHRLGPVGVVLDREPHVGADPGHQDVANARGA